MKLENMRDVMTVPEVAEYLQIGRTKAYEEVQKGNLKHIKIGKSIRIPKQYLVDYVYGKEVI